MIDLTYSLETIKDALHEKVMSINSAINRTIDNVKIRKMLIQRRDKFQNLLDAIVKDCINKNNTIVVLTTDEMEKLSNIVEPQVSDHTNNFNEKKMKKAELEKMCRTLHLDKLYMLNQTLGSIRNSDYNLLDEETKQLANKLYDALSKNLSQIG